MNGEFVDTDVLIRLITGDDPVKQAAAEAIFQRVEAGGLALRAPDTVIADVVFVLTSPRLHAFPRPLIRDKLAHLVGLPGFLVHNRRLLLRALDIFATTNLDFGDAMIVATMERRTASSVYSYGHDFDHVPGIFRREPRARDR